MSITPLYSTSLYGCIRQFALFPTIVIGWNSRVSERAVSVVWLFWSINVVWA